MLSIAALALGVASSVAAADKKPMVSIGGNGKLQYELDARGNRMPDFSMCGYMGGGVKIPVAVPNDLALCKTDLCAQFLVLCPGGSGAGLTNAVQFRVGG